MPELDLAPAPGTGLIRNATTGLVSDLDSSYTSVLYLVGNEVQVLATDAQALLVGRTAANPAFAVATNTANSVTGLLVTAAVAGGGVTLTATSSGANEILAIKALGTGTLDLYTNGVLAFRVNHVASAVDYISVTPAATANPATVSITAAGTDTNIHLSLIPAGTGAVLVPAGTAANPGLAFAGATTTGIAGVAASSVGVVIAGTEYVRVNTSGLSLKYAAPLLQDTNGLTLLAFTAAASAVDHLTIADAATANPATLSITASGSDTNIHISLVTAGTGAVLFPNGTAANPGLVEAGSTTTGLWRPAANQLGVSINGTDSFRFVNNGFHMLSTAMYVRDVANGNAVIAYASAANAVDYLSIGNVATGNPAVIPITASGSDTNIGVNFALAGTGTFAVNGVVSQVQNARLTADTSAVNNSIVLANVGLTLTIGANEIWLVTYFLAVSQASAAAGLRFGLTGPAGLAFIGWGTTFSAAAVTGGASAAANPFFNATNAGTETSAILTVRVTATAAGTINLQFAQSVATAANTLIQNGSYYHATRVA